MLDDPEATLADLMEHVKGPDFPTKGIIMGRSGIRAAYATGRGRLMVRARHEFEEFGKDRTRIIITEIPYQVNKRHAHQEHGRPGGGQAPGGHLRHPGRVRPRTACASSSSSSGTPTPRWCSTACSPRPSCRPPSPSICWPWWTTSPSPSILSLRHILDEYLAFQEEVIIRRTKYDLRKAQERAHLLEGLLVAQDNIDEVIQIIRTEL